MMEFFVESVLGICHDGVFVKMLHNVVKQYSLHHF